MSLIFTKAAIAASFFSFLSTSALAADVGTIDLSDAKGWVDRQPPPPDALHIREVKIWAPTPCHHAVMKAAGESKSNPPVPQFEVTIEEPASNVVCILVVSRITVEPLDIADYANGLQVQIFYRGQEGQLLELQEVH
ncbi:MAG: hypothetical protein E5Y10_31790 [Mesorhizobium sp.]|uniref:hypothetical protein n=1 Tax=Mesorhizobium sp. TaxID=1871066 RepID=UPI00121EE2E6|nr:hypothetical protein [Mesorhizobium sp.]TIN33737.1 MAG: hypothetical protein E5Y13_31535 [Mesorhizobium sp.]TJU84135.1 MAG: hypothetical protein E5Y10_31790 [Mesorhizobium sp.]